MDQILTKEVHRKRSAVVMDFDHRVGKDLQTLQFLLCLPEEKYHQKYLIQTFVFVKNKMLQVRLDRKPICSKKILQIKT